MPEEARKFIITETTERKNKPGNKYFKIELDASNLSPYKILIIQGLEKYNTTI